MTIKVLVITGGFLTLKEESLFVAIKKQISQWKASEHTWLETEINLVTALPVLLSEYHRKGRRAKMHRNGAVYHLANLTIAEHVVLWNGRFVHRDIIIRFEFFYYGNRGGGVLPGRIRIEVQFKVRRHDLADRAYLRLDIPPRPRF